MNEFETKAREMEKERGKIGLPTFNSSFFGYKHKSYHFNKYVPDLNTYEEDKSQAELAKVESFLYKVKKKEYTFPSENIEDPEAQFNKAIFLSEVAHLPDKKGHGEILTWETFNKQGPNKMQVGDKYKLKVSGGILILLLIIPYSH